MKERNEDGSYATRLPWNAKHHMLADNMSGRMLERKFERIPQYQYQNQLENGIIEVAPENPNGESFLYAT